MKKGRLFPLGQVCGTPGAQEGVLPLILRDALIRHQSGDWGDICDADRAENELALEHGFRVHSAYEYAGQPKFWVITEADRSVTTFLLPSEY